MSKLVNNNTKLLINFSDGYETNQFGCPASCKCSNDAGRISDEMDSYEYGLKYFYCIVGRFGITSAIISLEQIIEKIYISRFLPYSGEIKSAIGNKD